MKHFLFGILLSFSSPAFADGIIIGFKGKNNAWDQAAFELYAEQRGMTPVALSARAQHRALSIIKDNPVYELYGFSLGAETVIRLLREVVKLNLPKPQHIITIGAYKTVNVDFTPYGIKFMNYFDASGQGNQSPGIYIHGVKHLDMQRYIANKPRLL